MRNVFCYRRGTKSSTKRLRLNNAKRGASAGKCTEPSKCIAKVNNWFLQNGLSSFYYRVLKNKLVWLTRIIRLSVILWKIQQANLSKKTWAQMFLLLTLSLMLSLQTSAQCILVRSQFWVTDLKLSRVCKKSHSLNSIVPPL